MRIQLLLASEDIDYINHLSNFLADKHTDDFEVIVCSTREDLLGQLAAKRIDIALMEAPLLDIANLESVQLPLHLWTQYEKRLSIPDSIAKVNKYQRITSMVGNIIELYSKGLSNTRSLNSKKAHITAFWAPIGGVGKTTAALAYAAGKAMRGKAAMYLDLEQFSSVGTYFKESGKSISSVFEMLESEEGNVQMLIKSISKHDNDSGISYLCRPENFDDMNILTTQNIESLVDACSEVTDELIIDMSSVCDNRTQRVFYLVDKVFIVIDESLSAQIKYAQFATQHNVYQSIRDKTAIVANKGAILNSSFADEIICLPFVRSQDPITVYKTLSGISFDSLSEASQHRI